MTLAVPTDTRSRRGLWPELALAWTSLALFAAAIFMTVRATEYAWDVEADFAVNGDQGQGLSGLTFYFYEVILAPAAIVHLLSVLLATYRAASARPAGGAGRAVIWVAYVLGVVSVAAACAFGMDYAIGLTDAPESLRDRAMFFQGAPVLVAALAGVVPFVWSRNEVRFP
ncbi:hypothetical protein NSZ01_06190 [Nocardioides szechwanensis]|uniref:Uncharacterized protein n=1 Tax=Nocardioides szechwanensis TaxID=1005944 RepID=A0A1G9VS02_9ACTN|nr:hypothetical protein [Nocardioides szechwanensis]GEP32851.1 hypothetical protein NSZ01_06190 [Nocardioides szechwanensis]SDM74887.1 hypothetical protein SAMN05192576_0843 [Nocardioides szechwanensis]